MLKNEHFLERTMKVASEPSLASGGWKLRPQTPTLLLSPAIIIL